MTARQRPRIHRPRAVRWRVVVPARLRHGASWSDICILNVSSGGLLIHSGRPLQRGTEVEVHRGDHAIVAKVVWREGARAGLKADEQLAVDEIVMLGQAPSLQRTSPSEERRKCPRREDRARAYGRSIEFAGALVIAVTLASAGVTMIESAFARPLSMVAAALDR